MSRIKKILLSTRVIVLAVFLILAVIAINPQFGDEGVAIRSVLRNSSAYDAGIPNPNPKTQPTSRELIISVNSKPVADEAEFYSIIDDVPTGYNVTIVTDTGFYLMPIRPETVTIVLNETEDVIVPKTVQVNRTINGTEVTVNETVNRTITQFKTKQVITGRQDTGLKVYPAPKNNIREGLDLTGGTRVLLEPEERLSAEDMEIVLENLKQRLNVYGLTDIIVRQSNDLEGNQFILVEIAGANEEEVQDLIESQGKFEAKVGNTTVFRGGQDITYVARSADRAGIDPQYGCRALAADQYTCRFRFGISLSPEAAERQADATRDLDIITDENDRYLSEPLFLYLDNQLVDQLNIAADLKGSSTTEIAISGSGVGTNREEATYDALNNMKRLQTILITGSLPVKLKVVQSNSISPSLGEEFVDNAILVGLLAMVAVTLIVYIRYRNWKIILPMAVTMASEVVLLLGLAALIGWNLDLAAIAGIIIAVGTGVDDQIVITDETLSKHASRMPLTWKQKIKRAFFIIMAAYFTTVVAMAPLWFAGAGLLKGFAITTIFGVTFGVFITRPAFAAMVEQLVKE